MDRKHNQLYSSVAQGIGKKVDKNLVEYVCKYAIQTDYNKISAFEELSVIFDKTKIAGILQ